MGIYSAKFNLESAVEDPIQTPDDVGVDLKQVEEDIMGKDGIEAHRDEVKAAEEGLIGDPVEEAAFIMYESEYNYNQLMEAIGMTELREASYGREVLYEAGGIRDFLAHVVKIITGMFETITKTVKDVLAKMDFMAKADKKFVEKYEAQIKEGATKDWKAKGFTFPVDLASSFKLDAETKLGNGKNYLDQASSLVNSDLSNEKEYEAAKTLIDELNSDANKKKVIKTVSGVDADDLNGMTEKLIEKLYGTKEENLNGKVSANKVIEILKNDRETKTIRDLYKKVQKSYSETIADIKKLSRGINDSKVASKAMNICEAAARAAKFEKNVVNNAYCAYMKAARAKRAQARSLAHAFVRAAGKKVEAQHNSASISGGIFSSINLV